MAQPAVGRLCFAPCRSHSTAGERCNAASSRQICASCGERVARGRACTVDAAAFWWRRNRTTVGIAVLAGLTLGLAAWEVPMTRSVPSETIVLRGSPDVRSIIDGDTFKVGDRSIRLHGIDAPELAQTCDGWAAGEAARKALVALRSRAHLRAHPSRRTSTAGQSPSAASQVRTSAKPWFAQAWLTLPIPMHEFLLQERRARFDGRGIHARRCANPADWRASHRTTASARHPTPSSPAPRRTRGAETTVGPPSRGCACGSPRSAGRAPARLRRCR